MPTSYAMEILSEQFDLGSRFKEKRSRQVIDI